MSKKMKNKEKRIKISEEIDIAMASFEARKLAEAIGSKQSEQCMVSTVVSELARNIFLYAMKGEVTIRAIERKGKKGIEVVAEDEGPGIEDIGKAMEDHFSTSGSLGLGLPGVKRLMDEFMIDTDRRRGTKVVARMWIQKTGHSS